jgi:hypothetical protein
MFWGQNLLDGAFKRLAAFVCAKFLCGFDEPFGLGFFVFFPRL